MVPLDQNVFDIQQRVSIGIFIKEPDKIHLQGSPCRIVKSGFKIWYK